MESNAPDVQLTERLSPSKIDLVLVHMIRREAILAAAAGAADVDLFRPEDEPVYDAVWRALLGCYRELGGPPARTVLLAQAASGLQAGAGYRGGNSADFRHAKSHQEQYRDIADFIEAAYLTPEQDLSDRVANLFLRRLLQERTVSDALQAIVGQVARTQVAVNLPEVMGRLVDREARLSAIGVPDSYGLLDALDGDHFQPRNPTGIDFVDASTSPVSTEVETTAGAHTGGFLPREKVLWLGPHGGGKTHTSIMLTVEAADRYANGFGGEPPGTRRAGIYMHYEMPKGQISKRAIAYSARIPSGRLLGSDFRARLSDGANPDSYQPYELPWINEDRRAGRPPRAEKQRLEEAAHRLVNWRSFEMRNEGTRRAGSGWVPEVRAKLEQLHSSTGLLPSFLVLDYAGVMAERHIQETGKDFDRTLRHLLKVLGDEVDQQICSRFGCVAIVMHQLKGQDNNKSISHIPSHGEAAECSGMGASFDWAFCYGVMCKQTKVMWFNPSKTRDAEGLRGAIPVKLEGSFSRIRRADDEFVFASGAFRSRREVSAVVDLPPAPQFDMHGSRPLDM